MRTEQAIEVYSVYTRFTLDVINSSGLGITTSALKNPDDELLHHCHSAVAASTIKSMTDSIGYHIMFAIPNLPSWIAVYASESFDYFYNMTTRIMRNRKAIYRFDFNYKTL